MRTGDAERIAGVLTSWLGTRYHRDAPVRGVGAGCAGFVCAVLDEVFGLTEPLPFAAEVEFSNETIPIARALVRRYDLRVVAGRPTVLDVLAIRQHGGKLHLMLAGPRLNTLWHCGAAGVAMTGVGEVDRIGRLAATYRPGLEVTS